MFIWFLRALLSEVGDQSFILVFLLSAWCPWEGPRCGNGASFQRFLVWAGAMTALTLWIFFGSIFAKQQDVVRSACYWISAACLLMLVPRAFIEMRKSEAEDAKQQERLAGKKPVTVSSLGSHFIGTGSAHQAIDQQNAAAAVRDYGSLGPPSSFDKTASASDGFSSACLALSLPFILVFSLESGQDVWTASGHPQKFVEFLGAALGSAVAMLVAIIVGYILERQLLDTRLNFLVTVALCIVALGSVSQAVIHVGGLDLAAGRTSVMQLLQLLFNSKGPPGSSFLHSE